MLLPSNDSEIEPLFGFYRYGWNHAFEGRPNLARQILPVDKEGDSIFFMFAQYDYIRGYDAAMFRKRRLLAQFTKKWKPQ